MDFEKYELETILEAVQDAILNLPSGKEELLEADSKSYAGSLRDIQDKIIKHVQANPEGFELGVPNYVYGYTTDYES